MNEAETGLSIVLVGASGDLARKKVLPAFFALYCQGLLPKDFAVFGLARTRMTDDEFRQKIEEHLACRYTPGETCGERMKEFLSRCHYVSGEYSSSASFLDVYQQMRKVGHGVDLNCLFYLAIPPAVFSDASKALASAGFVRCGERNPWSRVVVEKPFGSDRSSSDELSRELGEVFVEEQTFRIDHYLGKEMVQNLMVLRFANTIFEPIWNSKYIEAIDITWKEDIGVEERAGYFDGYGIIRDVVQNHLMQILALLTLEPPKKFNAASILNEKVRLLRAMKPISLQDVFIGQYGPGERKGIQHVGYSQERGILKDSRTPTFCAMRLSIENPRWSGVPVTVVAGKGLDEKKTEMRIRFRDMSHGLFCSATGCPPANDLIIRVQPDESVALKVVNKVPGFSLKLASRDLDLTYREAFTEIIPEAYESLLLDVIRGEKSLFIRNDELEAAWDLFTPLLHELENKRIKPVEYPFFGNGPAWSFKQEDEGIANDEAGDAGQPGGS